MCQTDCDNNAVEQQYLGYSSTPNLWNNQSVYDLQQFEFFTDTIEQTPFEYNLPSRLGKRVERFVFEDLKAHNDIELLAHNLQIQHQRQTLGEMDALLLYKHRAMHLEIIYKFYLYDTTIGLNEFDPWIGPNRNDTLVKKLNKLKNKQLPLLYNSKTLPYIDALSLDIKTIKQQVLFKAQLFLPYGMQMPKMAALNTQCVVGYYIPFEALPSWSKCHFYIPSKLNWLLVAHLAVDWITYEKFKTIISNCMLQHQSPLVWIKHPNGTLERAFIVWW